MAEQCDGRRVGLFSQEDMAPADASLAGIPLGASARAKTRCDGETTELQLLLEDQRVSTLGSGAAHLCATCAAAYDARCCALGCTGCGVRLATADMTSEHADITGLCAQCAMGATVSAATAAMRQELEELRELAAAPTKPAPRGEPLGPDGLAPAFDRTGEPLGICYATMSVKAPGGGPSVMVPIPSRRS